MLNGLEILIERMKTHPEEFTRDGKWVDMLVNIDAHITEEERASLKQGFSDAAREKFNELVLKSIANEGIEWYEVDSLRTTYEGVMSYPLEKRRMIEEEQKQRAEQQLYKERLSMQAEMQRQQRNAIAQQSPAYSGSGLSGMLGSGGIF